MLIRLLADRETMPECVHFIARSLPKPFPKCLIQADDSGFRYETPPRSGRRRISRVTWTQAKSLDGYLVVNGRTYRNLYPVASRFKAENGTAKALLITHSNFVYFDREDTPYFRTVGPLEPVSGADWFYSGRAFTEDGLVIAGIKNAVDETGLMVAIHETGHLLNLYHCHNNAGNAYCVMSSLSIQSFNGFGSESYRAEFGKLGLKFCSPCYSLLSSIAKRNPKR